MTDDIKDKKTPHMKLVEDGVTIGQSYFDQARNPFKMTQEERAATFNERILMMEREDEEYQKMEVERAKRALAEFHNDGRGNINLSGAYYINTDENEKVN